MLESGWDPADPVTCGPVSGLPGASYLAAPTPTRR